MAAKKTSVVIVGAGGFARVHVGCMLGMEDTVRIAGFVDPAEKAREVMAKRYAEEWKKNKVPPFYNTIEEFLAGNKGPADCAVVVSPHNLHVTHIIECMKAGMDTLVEKPMVLSAAEARRAMKVRDETGRLLSIAYPGNYSTLIQKGLELAAAGEIGRVMSIAGITFQRWLEVNTGTWRQVPEISGGGYLFDTGSHTINMMLTFAGSAVRELAAVQDNRGSPVDIATAVSGRFENGVFFTLCAEGNSVNSMMRVTVMGTGGVLVFGPWGEYLRLMKQGSWEEKTVEHPPHRNTFEQFLDVRAGRIPNPCPAEAGLRVAEFMDRVREAVAPGGRN